ncbi:MAG: phospholipase [Phycisphaerales bacterium]|nr:MAG: phospholipase [Phycisphaerales bacterium]
MTSKRVFKLDVPGHGATVDVLSIGPDNAPGVLIGVHGRGGRAEDFASVATRVVPDGVRVLLPQAPGQTWYPKSFMAPTSENQPELDRALATLEALAEQVRASGLGNDHIGWVGFSQGACLTLEHLARNPARYAGVVGLCGGLIGPEGTAFDHEGDMSETPVYLGGVDPDPHVAWSRIEATARVFGRLGARVTLERTPDAPHTVLPHHADRAASMFASLGSGS